MALTEDLLLQGGLLERRLLNFHGDVMVLMDRQVLSNTLTNLWYLNLLGIFVLIYAVVS